MFITERKMQSAAVRGWPSSSTLPQRVLCAGSRIRVRAAECIAFDPGSPYEHRRLRTLSQSLQLDGAGLSASRNAAERAAAARAAAAAAALVAAPSGRRAGGAAAAAAAGADDDDDDEGIVAVTGTGEAHANSTTTSTSSSSSNGNGASDSSTSSSSTSGDAGGAATDESRAISRELRECRCVQDVLDVLADEGARMSAHNTVTALGRLAALGRRLPQAERAALLSAPPFAAALRTLAAQLPEMNAFQVVNALHSAAVLGAPLGDVPNLSEAADEAVARLAPEFNGRDVSGALHAYALLGHARPRHDAALRLAERTQLLLEQGELDGRCASTALWAAGSLGLRHSGLAEAACRALLADNAALLSGMAGQGVANSVWGLARASPAAVDGALLDAALDALLRLGDAAKPQEVLNALWACARCRHDPGARWRGVLAYCERRAGELAPADVVSLFHALGTFGHAPAPVTTRSKRGTSSSNSSSSGLDALLARAHALLPSMSPLEAATLHRGLGLSGLAHSAAWRDLTATVLPSLWRAGGLAPEARRMTFQGFLAGRLAGADAPPPPPQLLLDLKTAWDEGLALRPRCAPAGRGRRSALGAEVTALLDALGVKHDADVPTADGLSIVDVQLRAGGGRWVALQLAGEHEFAANTGAKLGAAALQQSLLEKAGYDDVRWLAARDLAGKPAHRRPLYMVELLRSLGVGVSAAAARLAEAEALEGDSGGGGGAEGSGAGALGRAAQQQRRLRQRRDGGGGGAGGGGDFDTGGVVRVSEAELLFDDPKVSGGRGGGAGRRRRAGGSGSGGSGSGARRR